jgi:outer membrane cobalamin receptor
MVPGFSLFRRSSSLVANPTTQGVSLRGLGSSGASRSLVLWDGIPLNSPFGGWIYWTRVSPEQLDRVEVSRGASTSVFGDKAMGGSIGLFTGNHLPNQPARASGWLGYEGGNAATHQVQGGGTLQAFPRLALSANARASSTAGYYVVPQPTRGPIDTHANLRFIAATARADLLAPRQRLFLRADALAEERENGTTMTRNSTSLDTLAANYWRDFGPSVLNLIAFHSREQYRATFSSIGPGRQTERLTSTQRVPSEATGASGHLRRSASRWSLLAGGDFLRSEGYSFESLFPSGSRLGGGVQQQFGLHAQTDAAFGPLRLFGGFRGQDAGAGRALWMPSAGATLGSERWRLRASAYRAFRSPTLNELFRDFRAGNTLTLANPNLHPETLGALEAGADFVSGPFHASITAFHNSLAGLITNVTRTTTPVLITRQRDNSGAATVRGTEASVARRWSAWSLQASYLLADSRFVTGERVPQVPRHQGSALASWQRSRTQVTASLRATSLQFEDDRNLYALPAFAVLQFTLRHTLPRGFSASFALENALDRTIVVGYNPTPQTGAPRLWRVGLTWSKP